ncbi:MAG: Panacea domain-containing protein [Lachnospiraceae bacterium]
MERKCRKDFCVECRKDTEYALMKKTIKKIIRDREYTFSITSAVCTECGAQMSLPGLIDKNIQEMDEQYRVIEGIVSVEDIEKIMKIYKIGKAPLSLALGFGEVTVARYLSGQMPSKEYSEIMRTALTSPAYMKGKLMRNKDKIAEAAYNKAMAAAVQMENLFSVSEKMLRVLSYVFERLEEVTPLMLQKLLYFIQGISYVLQGRPMFREDCQAWIHGPVYPEVYDLFKSFSYNPIEDARFAVLEGTTDALTEEERKAIDLVVDTYGLYGGKVLERITHNEIPWQVARRGYGDNIPSNEVVTKESIKEYYMAVDKKYGLSTKEGIMRYIRDILKSTR